MIFKRNLRESENLTNSLSAASGVEVIQLVVYHIASEIDRLKKESAKVDKDLVALNRKLFNEDFLSKAPREVIDKEKTKHEELMRMKDKITDSINMLKGAEV